MTVRLIVMTRLTLGALLLAAPDALVAPLAGRPIDGRERTAARLLGVRSLVEGAAINRHPSKGLLLAGAAVDATHSLSMVVLAAVRPRYRRTAIASALAAATTAAASVVAARSPRHEPAGAAVTGSG